MKITKTKFKNLLIINGKKFKDSRGYLREIYLEKVLNRKLRFSIVTSSKKNVIRGLHLQVKKPQSKHISVIKGKILDVVVDLRKNSKTFGKVFKIILSDKNLKSLYVPNGFAHGYLTLAKENIVVYSCDKYREPKYERSINWSDKSLKIQWNTKKPIISKKDKGASNLNFFLKNN